MYIDANDVILVFLWLILNRVHTLFWFSIVVFEQVNADWVAFFHEGRQRFSSCSFLEELYATT